MLEFLTTHVSTIANLLAILVPLIGVLTWSHRKLRAETKEIREDMKAMNTRIDHLYQVMMGMLQKKG